MRTILFALTASTLLAGCFELELPKTDTADTGAGDTGAGDTGAGDTATEDTAGDDTAGDDTGPTEVVGTAQVRFVNTMSVTTPAGFHAENLATGDEVTADLYQTQGSAYQDLPAGDAKITVIDGAGAELIALDVALVDGGQYSIALMPGTALAFSVDDSSGIEGNSSRINIIDGQDSGTADNWIGYYNGTSYSEDYTFSLDYGSRWIMDLPYATSAVRLELEWAELDNLVVDWNIATFVQVDPGTLKNVYVWNDGDCSAHSRTCTPMILAQFADGSTSTVEGSFDWAE